MCKRSRNVRAALLLLAGAVGSTIWISCGIIGTLEFDVKFRPTGLISELDCQQAQVTNIRFQFFDQALDNLLRTEVTRPCVPGEVYKVSIDLGPYNILVQGLNGQQTVCYEGIIPYTVQGGKTDRLTIVADQHPDGAAGGCVYPGGPGT